MRGFFFIKKYRFTAFLNLEEICLYILAIRKWRMKGKGKSIIKTKNYI